MREPWLKLTEYLTREDYERINKLQEKCINADNIALKLELDYKLAVALEKSEKAEMKEINEFQYFDGEQLVGYIGICSFGGAGMPLEITGMVDPLYRRQGIFTKLSELVTYECRRRNSSEVLVLCDRKSSPGQKLIEKIGAKYKHTEFEMYLQKDFPEPKEEQFCGINLKKATNLDANEIARQNSIYFGDIFSSDSKSDENIDKELNDVSTPDDILWPENEEKRGITIYLGQKENQTIGKVHLDTNTTVGGIYGLGILPEYRGKGYGKAILLRAIEKLKEEKKEAIMLQVEAKNSKALNLYKSCGFAETSIMDYFEMNY